MATTPVNMVSVIVDFGTPTQRVVATVPEKLTGRLEVHVNKARLLTDEGLVTLLGPWTNDNNFAVPAVARTLTKDEDI